MMRILLRPVLCFVLVAAAGVTPALAKTYSADRFDVQVRVLPGNLLEVVETVVFRFEDGTFDHVFREIPTRRTDGVEIVGVTMDGRPFPFGDGVGQAEVTGRSKIRVRWQFPSVGDSTHAFGLTYRVRGAVRRGGDGRDELVWQALPGEHEYRIATATAEFVFPSLDAAAVGEPRVEWRRIEGPTAVERTGAAEAGGSGTPATIVARASDIRKNGWMAATFSLPPGQLIVTPPDWQAEQHAANALAGWWLGGAAGLAAIGLIGLFGIRQQYDAPPRDVTRLSATSMAPEQLDPAVAGALISNGRTSHEHAVATLFGLAERGAVTIEERPRGRFGQRTFSLRRGHERASLAPHEAALLELLFHGQESATLPDAWRHVSGRFKRFSSAVQARLAEAGLLDPDRQRVRRRTLAFAVGAILLAGVMAIGAAILTPWYGPWPFVLPGALVVVAVTGFIVAGSTITLSNDGARRAERWRAYRDGLKESAASGGRSFAPSASELLGMAVALGLGGVWAKQLKQHPGLVPAWFQGLADSDGTAIATLVAMGSTGHHGGAGAGAGAAGAAGGGASGAG